MAVFITVQMVTNNVSIAIIPFHYCYNAEKQNYPLLILNLGEFFMLNIKTQEKFTEKQLKAIELLALREVQEMSMEQIALEVEVARKTLYEWQKDQAFKNAVNKRALECMADYAPLLLKELKGLIKSKNEATKLRAVELVAKSIEAQEDQQKEKQNNVIDVEAFLQELGI